MARRRRGRVTANGCARNFCTLIFCTVDFLHDHPRFAPCDAGVVTGFARYGKAIQVFTL